jgi:hypothetical protein
LFEVNIHEISADALVLAHYRLLITAGLEDDSKLWGSIVLDS